MPEPVYRYRARLRRVIDGDTFVADVDLGFGAHVWITVRIRGVDAPERNDPGGYAAVAFLGGKLAEKVFVLQSFKDRQSFARWICDVWVEGEPLADAIVESGHGVAA